MGTPLVVLVMSSVDANQPMSSAVACSALGQTTQITTPLSPLERQRADNWQISEFEWRRYQSLKEGVRGSISPANLSPIEVLGIHACDVAERWRYAERWAQIMRDDADLREWANGQAIEPIWVRTRRVTLNHDTGALAELSRGQGQPPYLLRCSGDEVVGQFEWQVHRLIVVHPYADAA